MFLPIERFYGVIVIRAICLLSHETKIWNEINSTLFWCNELLTK
jgi:hypothetical protein